MLGVTVIQKASLLTQKELDIFEDRNINWDGI